jgi:hypothetical protein
MAATGCNEFNSSKTKMNKEVAVLKAMAVAIHGCWNPSSCLEAPGSERQLSDSRK